MPRLQDFIRKHAIPCKIPVGPAISRLWDTDTERLLEDETPKGDRQLSNVEFLQYMLLVHLRLFRENRPHQPPFAMYEAWKAAGRPMLVSPWPEGMHLWTSVGVVEACIENVALILSRADDPLMLVQRAGFANIDDCLRWAGTLPHATRIERALGDQR